MLTLLEYCQKQQQHTFKLFQQERQPQQLVCYAGYEILSAILDNSWQPSGTLLATDCMMTNPQCLDLIAIMDSTTHQSLKKQIQTVYHVREITEVAPIFSSKAKKTSIVLERTWVGGMAAIALLAAIIAEYPQLKADPAYQRLNILLPKLEKLFLPNFIDHRAKHVLHATQAIYPVLYSDLTIAHSLRQQLLMITVKYLKEYDKRISATTSIFLRTDNLSKAASCYKVLTLLDYQGIETLLEKFKKQLTTLLTDYRNDRTLLLAPRQTKKAIALELIQMLDTTPYQREQMGKLFDSIKDNKPPATYHTFRIYHIAIAVEAYCWSQQYYNSCCYIEGELIDDETPKWQEHIAAAEIHIDNINMVARGIRQGWLCVPQQDQQQAKNIITRNILPQLKEHRLQQLITRLRHATTLTFAMDKRADAMSLGKLFKIVKKAGPAKPVIKAACRAVGGPNKGHHYPQSKEDPAPVVQAVLVK